MKFLHNPIVLLALTLFFYFCAQILQKRTKIMLLNPILITVTLLILLMRCCGIDYSSYKAGGDFIAFWLKPAVVALGVPLYLQLESIKKQLIPILLSQLVGCVVGVTSVVLIAKWMGATPEVILSMAPKSVTTPIAMEVSSTIGGIQSLTAAVVVVVGLLGGVFGFSLMRLLHIDRHDSQGLAIGAASHAVGTSAAMDVSAHHGAYASLGLTLNGILTALLTPLLIQLLGIHL